MDPARKRTLRFTTALVCALLLAGALVYTSFTASSEAKSPSQLASAAAGETYQLTGKVVKGSIQRSADSSDIRFAVEDRTGGRAVPVSYSGTVPDAFRDGREVIIDVRKGSGTFIGEPDSLITKCPSKFKAEGTSST